MTQENQIVLDVIKDNAPKIASLILNSDIRDYIQSELYETLNQIESIVTHLEQKDLYQYRNIADAMQDRINLQADIKLALSDYKTKIKNHILLEISGSF